MEGNVSMNLIGSNFRVQTPPYNGVHFGEILCSKVWVQFEFLVLCVRLSSIRYSASKN